MTSEEARERIYTKKTEEEWLSLYDEVFKMDRTEFDKLGRDVELLLMTCSAIKERRRE